MSDEDRMQHQIDHEEPLKKGGYEPQSNPEQDFTPPDGGTGEVDPGDE